MTTTLAKSLAFAILALLLGVPGLVLVFSDPSESWEVRILTATLFFILCGLGIGFFNPSGWIVAGLTAWGGIFMGSLIVFAAIRKFGELAFSAQEPPYIAAGLVMLFIPVGLALVGGYIGKVLRQRFPDKGRWAWDVFLISSRGVRRIVGPMGNKVTPTQMLGFAALIVFAWTASAIVSVWPDASWWVLGATLVLVAIVLALCYRVGRKTTPPVQ